GHHFVDHADVASVSQAVSEHRHHPEIPAYTDLAAYRAAGGDQALQGLRSGELIRDKLVEIVDQAGLRGCGGAGFPTARKWKSVLGEPGPRLMAGNADEGEPGTFKGRSFLGAGPGPRVMTVNADEGEPGTFKDRYFLDTDPHRVLEGMLIGAHLVESPAVYFYLRDEYPACREILAREIAALDAAGLLAGVKVHLRRGAGAHIGAEEAAVIESIEG